LVTKASLDVTPAAEARATKGSRLWCPPEASHVALGAGCSVTEMPSNPAASAADAMSAMAPASRRSISDPFASG